MGTHRGRPAKPTAVKRMEGNRGHRRLNDNEPKPPIALTHEPPEWLGEIARGEWVRLCSELESQNMLTSWDWSVFAAYCESYGQWRELAALVEEDGASIMTPNGYKTLNPDFLAMEKCRKSAISFGALLGLNPSDRARLNVKAAATDNPAKAFFDDGETPNKKPTSA